MQLLRVDRKVVGKAESGDQSAHPGILSLWPAAHVANPIKWDTLMKSATLYLDRSAPSYGLDNVRLPLLVFYIAHATYVLSAMLVPLSPFSISCDSR